MASSEQYSLCWNNFHTNMSAGFHSLLSQGDLVDVTLAAEGQLLQAHKLVLSVCSPYFLEMFKMNPTQHPIIFLKDVSYSTLRDLLQFMYQGEVNVNQEELASFINTAEQLQVKGLMKNLNEESSATIKAKSTPWLGSQTSQRGQITTKLEIDIDSKPLMTPAAVKRLSRTLVASSNPSLSQTGPSKRKCVDSVKVAPPILMKEEYEMITDEDDDSSVVPKRETEFISRNVWPDDVVGENDIDVTFGGYDPSMGMTLGDGSAIGDINITDSCEGGTYSDAQPNKWQEKTLEMDPILNERTIIEELEELLNDSDRRGRWNIEEKGMGEKTHAAGLDVDSLQEQRSAKFKEKRGGARAVRRELAKYRYGDVDMDEMLIRINEEEERRLVENGKEALMNMERDLEDIFESL